MKKKAFPVISLLFMVLVLILISACGRKSEPGQKRAKPAQPNAVETIQPFQISVSIRENLDSLRPKVIFSFNRRLLDEKGKSILNEPFFTVEPALELKQTAINEYHAEYTPVADLAPSAQYRITPAREIVIGGEKHVNPAPDQAAGLVIHDQAMVRDAFIDHADLQRNQLALTILFNFPPAPRSLRERISLQTGEGVSVPFQLSASAANEARLLITNPPMRLGRADASLRLLIGSGLESSADSGFFTRKDFRKNLALPQSTNLLFRNYTVQEAGDRYNIILSFSEDLDEIDPQTFISISPATATAMKRSGHQVTVEGPFIPGESVQLQVRPGMMSRDGRLLLNGTKQVIRFGGFSRQVGFSEKGTFVRLDGRRTLKFSYRNLDNLSLEAFQVRDNNIPVLYNFFRNYWENLDPPDERVSVKVLERKLDLPAVENRSLDHYLDLSELLPGGSGLYYLRLYRPDDYQVQDSLWVCITDIGLFAVKGESTLQVWAVSLADGQPRKNVELTLVSQSNQELGRHRTDNDGKVIFDKLPELANLHGEPFMVFARNGEELSFLNLFQQALDLSAFDTAGQVVEKGAAQVFAFSDRNLYRPGDTVNIGAVVRKRDGEAFQTVSAIPLSLELFNPGGQQESKMSAMLDDHGTAAFQWTWTDFQPTGFYTARLLLGKETMATLVLPVEEFMPQRVAAYISADRKEYRSSDQVKLRIEAKYLFGAPLAGGAYVLSGLREEQLPSPRGQSEYLFGRVDRLSGQSSELFKRRENLDAEGNAEIAVDLKTQSIEQYSSLLLKTEVFEQEGADSVSETVRVSVDPFGLHPGLSRNDLEEMSMNRLNRIRGVLVDLEGQPIKGARDIDYQVFLLETKYLAYYDYYLGRNRYRRETIETLLKEASTKAENGSFSLEFSAGDAWGGYRILARERNSGAVVSSTHYPWWWGYDGGSEKNRAPHHLEVSCNKTEAAPGEKVELAFQSPFNGRLLVSASADEVLHSSWFKAEKGNNKISFTIPRQAAAHNNVHLALLVVNSDYQYGAVPLRALGLVNLTIAHPRHRLELTLKHPETIKPNSELKITYNLRNHRGRGRLVVFAADEGILRIRKFVSPDPYAFFFARKAIGVNFHDILGLIMPEFAELYTGRSGYGDFEEMAAAYDEDAGRIARVKPVAMWSGFLDTDGSGKGEVSFKVPDFQGQLRIMALAVSEDRFGAAESSTLVKDKIQIVSSPPRFLHAGDLFQVPVTVINGTGQEGEFSVSVTAEGIEAGAPPQPLLKLAADASSSFYISCRAGKDPGASSLKITVSGQGESSSQSFTVPILPAGPGRTETILIECPPGETDISDRLSGWSPRFARATATLTPLFYSRELSYLKHLIGYPWGCLEQTVSATFPLLYIRNLDSMEDIRDYLKERDINRMIQEGVSRVLSMRDGSSGFRAWPGQAESKENPWLNVYTAHFLIEAHQKGFTLDQSLLNSLAEMVSNLVAREKDDSFSLAVRAYGHYVLGKLGRAKANELDFFQARHGAKLLPESLALVAGAYAGLGKVQQARQYVAESLQREQSADLSRPGRQDHDRLFFSPLRQRAVLFNVLLDLDQFADPELKNQLLMTITQELRNRENAWNCSTQELVWSLRGLTIFNEARMNQVFSEQKGKLMVGDQESINYEGSPRGSLLSAWSGRPVKVTNSSRSSFYLLLNLEGIREDDRFTPMSQGIEIERAYFDENGLRLDEWELQNLNHGQTLWVQLLVNSTGRLNNLVVVDRIPAGFVIENPRLSEIILPDWIRPERRLSLLHLDIKDHQAAFFADLPQAGRWEISYQVRAVTRGTFLVPPVSAEAMYDPVIRAAGSPVNVTID